MIATMPRSARRTGRNGTAPALVATSKACAKSGPARSRSPSSRWETPSACSMVARYGLAELSPAMASWASRRICATSVAASEARGRPAWPPSCCRQGAFRCRYPVRRRRPNGPPRPACRAAQGSTPRARRCPCSASTSLRSSSHSIQPAPCRSGHWPTPAASRSVRGGRPAPRRPRPWHARWPAPGIELASYHCAARGMQAGNEVRLAPAQLGVQQLPEQVVVAVPLAATVERDRPGGSALQLLERSAGSGSADDCIAEAAAHAVGGSTCG